MEAHRGSGHAQSSIVWLLVASFVLTIASFIAATLVAEQRARGLAAAAESITTNAMPSITCLSSARTELRQIELLLERLTDTDGPSPRRGSESDKADLRSSRRRLAQYWATCRALPTYPGERALNDAVDTREIEMDMSIDEVVVNVEAGNGVAAARELSDRTEPAVDRLDAAMVDAIELNARESSRLGSEITQMRTSSERLRSFLMTLSALLATAAAFFMVRVLRRFTALMESRVSDMEHFAGRVAHDIRSPLASVGLALELTKRDPERGIARGVLDRASATLQRIGQLVDGLLVFARSGEVPDESVATNAAEVIAAVMEEMQPSAEAASITLELEPIDRSSLVACSSGVLISLVSNLVGNAIKHMGSSPVRRVTVRAREVGRRLRFEVADTGPGVPAALRERIFDPYVRAAESAVPGIGLGLATVRRLAEAHSGNVGLISSDEGPGSTFWFELPKAQVEPRARATCVFQAQP